MPRTRVFDLALTGVLLLAAQLEAWLGPYDDRALLSASCAALVLPLAVRRHRPAAAGLAVALAFAAGQALTGSLSEMASGTLPLLIASYSVAAFLPARRALAVVALILVIAELSVLADPSPSSFAYAALVILTAAAVGRVVAARHGQVSELERTADRLQEELDTAVADERARIARELHDVVVHGVSMMVVQAGAAEAVVAADADAAAKALREIQQAGRQSLVELRRMLDLLRTYDEPAADVDDADLAPQPALTDLPALVESARAAGMQVELDLAPLPAVPSGLSLSAYRIVQEGLTNALRHAGPASVCISVRHADDGLELAIVDDGRGARSGYAPGHGLTGMRERVSLFDGDLDVRTSPGAGFAVTARLPLQRGR